MKNRRLQASPVYAFECQDHMDALKDALISGSSSFFDMLPTPEDELFEVEGWWDFWSDMEDSDLPLYSNNQASSEKLSESELFDSDRGLWYAEQLESSLDNMVQHPVTLIVREELLERTANIRIR